MTKGDQEQTLAAKLKTKHKKHKKNPSNSPEQRDALPQNRGCGACVTRQEREAQFPKERTRAKEGRTFANGYVGNTSGIPRRAGVIREQKVQALLHGVPATFRAADPDHSKLTLADRHPGARTRN